jgi:hypothetical protein
MHGSFDKQPKGDPPPYQNWSFKLVALPVLIVVALIGMVVSHPPAVKWVSDAVQAEFVGPRFVGTEIVPDLASPTQLARPTNQIRTVRAY